MQKAPPVRTYDNRMSWRPGRLHLGFELAGVRIAYAYIRKNGCSAFKRMLDGDPDAHVRGLAARYPYRRFTRYDVRIFVWRDPLERLLSVYRNKFLEETAAEDIAAAYEETLGGRPESFEDFVTFALRGRDPHCRSQASHLRRMRYTHAIPLARLHEAMREIVGPEADRHFARPVNASAPAPIAVSDRARAAVRRAYADDYRLAARLGAS